MHADGKEADLSTVEVLKEPYFSKKLLRLIGILSNFRLVFACSYVFRQSFSTRIFSLEMHLTYLNGRCLVVIIVELDNVYQEANPFRHSWHLTTDI